MPWLKILTMISPAADALDAIGTFVKKMDDRKQARRLTKSKARKGK